MSTNVRFEMARIGRFDDCCAKLRFTGTDRRKMVDEAKKLLGMYSVVFGKIPSYKWHKCKIYPHHTTFVNSITCKFAHSDVVKSAVRNLGRPHSEPPSSTTHSFSRSPFQRADSRHSSTPSPSLPKMCSERPVGVLLSPKPIEEHKKIESPTETGGSFRFRTLSLSSQSRTSPTSDDLKSMADDFFGTDSEEAEESVRNLASVLGDDSEFLSDIKEMADFAFGSGTEEAEGTLRILSPLFDE